ncbi:type 1 glutamine amidotransferase domain-containing protein [Staphylococcus cohnii]|uniref:type 1 glutamine amidotransferase domain-containing protein n=1 Tax=Staphylococcus cohnii TaxID=29382 RepID=UPI000588FD7B|nr:type 1 glutamine amidotransferase domain-containing protein [Staphylococcus cohnii]
MKKALIVVTNIAKYDNLDRPTGAWFSEVTHFAKDFYDAGYDVDFVSPNGGYVPIDPVSLSPEMMSVEDWKYYTDHDYMNQFGQTLSPKEVNPSDYQAIYFAGGHGAAGLLDIKENGDYLVRHKDVTGFTNSEEQANGTTEYMPYLLEDEFISNGAHFKKEDDWSNFAVVDGRIVTGQNPQSGHAVAEHALKILANQ